MWTEIKFTPEVSSSSVVRSGDPGDQTLFVGFYHVLFSCYHISKTLEEGPVPAGFGAGGRRCASRKVDVLFRRSAVSGGSVIMIAIGRAWKLKPGRNGTPHRSAPVTGAAVCFQAEPGQGVGGPPLRLTTGLKEAALTFRGTCPVERLQGGVDGRAAPWRTSLILVDSLECVKRHRCSEQLLACLN